MGNQWGLGIHLIFVTIFLVATTPNTCFGARNITVACFEYERLALLEFKHSMQDTFEMLSSWVGNDCCDWERVQCDLVTGHVERLHLARGEELLVGMDVPSSLAELQHLKYLDLSGNSFQGSRIPEFVGSFKHLTYLNLSYGDFSGKIPHHIGNLSKLEVLDISNNYPSLMEDDMAWIYGLSSLRYLDLSDVDLSRVVNYDILLYIFPSLDVLRLKGCGISGKFALRNSSATLSKIKHLNLGYNNFKRQEVPGFFRNMSSLESMDLSGFDLSQSSSFAKLLNIIPSLQDVHLSYCNLQNMHLSPTHRNFTSFSNIQLLNLRGNAFEGNFPSIVTSLSSLRVLDLSDCGLNSTVPDMPNLLELDVSENNFKQIEHLGICNNFSDCSQYALERLDLSFSNLNGLIPESMGRLPNLRDLDLSGNVLTGPIPECLVRLRLLESLDLSDNQLNGSIPESLGSLGALEVLILSHNNLTGPIPTSLGKLVSLRTFSVSSNLLYGTIPVSFGQLSKLRDLDISNNFLKGILYEAHFDNLLNLKYLSVAYNNKLTFNISRDWMPPFQLTSFDLSSCKIADEFPRWLRRQRKLQSLDMSHNKFRGPLPTWLREMPIITHLDLSHNILSGPLTNLPNGGTYDVFVDQFMSLLHLQNNFFNESIPWSLCRRKDLEYLNLSRNRLTGKLPTCLKNLKKLYTMIFSSNRLSGVIPSSIAPHSSLLCWLNLNDNNFGGDIPRELESLGDLRVLDLGDNKLSGIIPEWIGEKLTHLAVFRLHNNNFTGIIPRSLCTNSNLQILDVARNNLSGSIPHCLGGLSSMIWRINKTNFQKCFGPQEYITQVMKGVNLEYTTILQFVINMDLSSNKLVGRIPTEITALSALVGLNLSNNLLSGCIPENIGKMAELNSLDFSGNKLTGMIPQSMVDLHFLSHLNLSNNNLSGQIPLGNQLQTLDVPLVYAGNKDLCGDLLPKKCSSDEDLTPNHTNTYKAADEPKIVWFYLDIACGFATGFWGIIGVLAFKKEWRHKLFMFAEVTVDNIYVTIVVRFAKMKRRNETA